MYDDPPFRTQVKLVGRREGEKAKVKRETAAGNLYRLSGGALWRHSSLTCKDRLQDLAVKKAMIQQAYNFCCQQIHRFNLLGKSIGSKLIIDRILGSEFWSFFLLQHGCRWVLFCLYLLVPAWRQNVPPKSAEWPGSSTAVSRDMDSVVSQCTHATVSVTGVVCGGFWWDMNRDIMDVASVSGNGGDKVCEPCSSTRGIGQQAS